LRKVYSKRKLHFEKLVTILKEVSVEMAEKKRSYGLLESFAQIGRWDDSKKTTLTTFGRKDRVEKWVVTDYRRTTLFCRTLIRELMALRAEP